MLSIFPPASAQQASVSGKREKERCALINFTMGPNTTAMPVNDSLNRRQPNANSIEFAL